MYTSMQIIQQKANQNVIAIPSPYRGGQKGHLGLTMQDNLYFACFGQHFVMLADPRPYPAIPNGTSAPQWVE